MRQKIAIACSITWLIFTGNTLIFAQAWTDLYKVAASDKDSNAYYGLNVSVSGDYAVVGAHMKRSAYVLHNDQGVWTEVKILLGDSMSHGFGHSVFIDKDFIVVGAYGEDGDSATLGTGAAYLFGKDHGGANKWGMVKKILPDDPKADSWFGWKVSLSSNSLLVTSFAEELTALNGNVIRDAGKAFFFEKDHGGTNNWGLARTFTAPVPEENGNFGINSILKGDFAFIWSSKESQGYMYHRHAGGPNSWGLLKKIAYDGSFATTSEASVGLSDDYLAIGNPGKEVCIYAKNSGGESNWGFVKKIRHLGDGFGSSVSVSGKYLMIGARSELYDSQEQNPLISSGSVYIYENNLGGENNWELLKKVTAPDRQKDYKFGISASIDQNNAIVGAYEANGTGSVYLLDAFDNDVSGSSPDLLVAKKDSNALLSWKSASNPDLSYFDVEKSTDGISWISLGKVEPSTKSGDLKSYFFTDNNVYNGINYYRIKELSKSKSIRISPVRNLSFETKSKTIIFPNPTVDKFYINTSHLESIKSIKIINSLGLTVTETSSIKEGIVTNSLTRGVYTVQFAKTDGTVASETLAITN